MALLCVLQVSPATGIHFMGCGGGDVFDGGGNISDTHGPGGPAALQPFTAASTIILLDQAGHYPTNTHL